MSEHSINLQKELALRNTCINSLKEQDRAFFNSNFVKTKELAKETLKKIGTNSGAYKIILGQYKELYGTADLTEAQLQISTTSQDFFKETIKKIHNMPSLQSVPTYLGPFGVKPKSSNDSVYAMHPAASSSATDEQEEKDKTPKNYYNPNSFQADVEKYTLTTIDPKATSFYALELNSVNNKGGDWHNELITIGRMMTKESIKANFDRMVTSRLKLKKDKNAVLAVDLDVMLDPKYDENGQKIQESRPATLKFNLIKMKASTGSTQVPEGKITYNRLSFVLAYALLVKEFWIEDEQSFVATKPGDRICRNNMAEAHGVSSESIYYYMDVPGFNLFTFVLPVETFALSLWRYKYYNYLYKKDPTNFSESEAMEVFGDVINKMEIFARNQNMSVYQFINHYRSDIIREVSVLTNFIPASTGRIKALKFAKEFKNHDIFITSMKMLKDPTEWDQATKN